MPLIGWVSVTRSRELLLTDANTLSTGWKGASWKESFYETLLEPWWLITMVTVSTTEQKPFFQEALCLLPKTAHFPKGILFQEKERNKIPFFSYECIRGCKKLSTRKRPSEHRICVLAFFFFFKSGERILGGKEFFTWISTTQLLIQCNFSITEQKYIPAGFFEHSVPSLQKPNYRIFNITSLFAFFCVLTIWN